MAKNSVMYDIDYFTNAIAMAEQIIRYLENSDDTQAKLDSINMLNDLPKIPRDSESRQLKIYKEANEVYKNLYIAVARAIMSILDSDLTGIHDKSESYNYERPKEPIAAVEAIKLLPNAFVGGPIKSAINNNDPYVQMLAIKFFETLPSHVRISDIFPKDYNMLVKKLKPAVLKRVKETEPKQSVRR